MTYSKSSKVVNWLKAMTLLNYSQCVNDALGREQAFFRPKNNENTL